MVKLNTPLPTEADSEADRFSLRSMDFLTLKKKYARTNV